MPRNSTASSSSGHVRIFAAATKPVPSGSARGQLGIFADMRPRERVAVLLALLGGERSIELARRDILRVN